MEDIPAEDTPRTDIPVEVPDVPVEDEPLVEIPDEDVPAADIPVADVPQTGDDSGLWYVLLMASIAGLAVMGWLEIKDKRKTTVD